jgi:hypothetical protein
MGNVNFSPDISAARLCITAWHLILKRSKGLKVSSRLLKPSLRKASLNPSVQSSTPQFSEEQLKLAYKNYYLIKGSHRSMRDTFLEGLAEAIAAQGNQQKEKIIKTLREHGQQRHSARKICYLRGKIHSGSTTMVTTQDQDGRTIDLTKKEDIKLAIMKNNEAKFRQSSHTPFFQFPLAAEFGFKGLS